MRMANPSTPTTMTTRTRTVRTSCACASAPPMPARSSSVPRVSWPGAAVSVVRRAARSAGPHLPSTQRALRQLGDRHVRSRDHPRALARGRGRGRRADRGIVEQRAVRARHASVPDPEPPRPRRRLQADHRRAASRRLPRRDAHPPRGRRVACVGDDGLGDRPARRSCATARSARGWSRRSIEVDPDVDVVAMVVGDDARLRRMAVFDAAVNNTDRKGGHILPVDGGRHCFGVDHGVCFSTVPKLRTVLWGWRGTPFDPDEREGLERIRDGLADGDLGASAPGAPVGAEVRATRRRVEALLREERFRFRRTTGRRSPGRRSRTPGSNQPATRVALTTIALARASSQPCWSALRRRSSRKMNQRGPPGRSRSR